MRWPQREDAANEGSELRTRHGTVAQAGETLGELGFEPGELVLGDLKLYGFTDVAAQMSVFEANDCVVDATLLPVVASAVTAPVVVAVLVSFTVYELE